MSADRPLRVVRLGVAANCSSLGNVVNVLVWSQVAVAAVWAAAEAWQARRRRPEPDGGETRLVDEPPALVRTGEGGPPLEAHLQITEACPLPCPNCHVAPRADGAHVPAPVVLERARALAEAGVLRVALGGGEVSLHPELAELVPAVHALGLSVGVTTAGLHPESAEAFSGADQVNVSLDGLGDTYHETRGYTGDVRALDTVRRLRARGVRVGVNVVLTRRSLPHLGETVAAAEAAGVTEIQLLRLKPVGRARERYLDERLDEAQGLALWPTLRALLERHPGLSIRVDCALLPFLAAHDPDPERLARFGFWGCQGGDTLLSVDTRGRAHPCSFWAGPVEARWREGVREGACGGCPYQAVCRGGCHAVALATAGDGFAPDPECPRVLAAARATALPAEVAGRAASSEPG